MTGDAFVFALLGGFFMGSYPVPIKAPSVLKAEVNPVVFQLYKSFWVFVSGWLFVLARAIFAEGPTFVFTWWGLVSAAAWIPSGLCTIAAVPKLGVGMAVGVSVGTSTVLSFLTGWLVLGEHMKEHTAGGTYFYLAPVYLVGIMFGMILLSTIPTMKGCPLPCKRVTERREDRMEERTQLGEAAQCDERGSEAPGREVLGPSIATRAVGLALGCMAGACSAAQYAMVNIGKAAVQRQGGCAGDWGRCSADVREAFNTFGSWNASFGVGAAIMSLVFLAVVCFRSWLAGEPAPKFHFETLRVQGSASGILWALGSLFQTAAIVRGGTAFMMPANLAVQLITSGAWGLLYYREIPGYLQGATWTAAGAWTLAFIVLLGDEKA